MNSSKGGISAPVAIAIVVVVVIIVAAVGYKLFLGPGGTRVEDKTTTFQRPAKPAGPPANAQMQGSQYRGMGGGGMSSGSMYGAPGGTR